MFIFTDKQAGILSDIIHLAHADILSIPTWTDILELVGRVVPSDASAALFFDPETGKPQGYANRGFDTAFYQPYAEHFHTVEPVMPRALQTNTPVWRPHDIVPKSAWEKSPMYTDFVSAQGYKYFVTLAVRFGSGVPILVRLARSSRFHDFTNKDVHLLELMQPHFEVAYHKTKLGAGPKLLRQAIQSGFEQMDTAVFIFDSELNVAYQNKAARDLCDSLRERDGDALATITSAAEQIIHDKGHPFHLQDGHKEISLAADGRRFALVGFPVHAAGSPTYHVIFAADMMRHVHFTCRRSMQAFGLSSREIEVCEMVIKGLSNREAAERMGIADLTVKDHVKSIREKLGVSSRSKILPRLLGV